MLFESPRLGPRELRVAAAIGQIYMSLKHALSSPSRWDGILRRNLFARAIQGSNSIEGYLVSKEDAMAAVDGEPPAEASQQTWMQIIGYRNAMTFVLQLAKSPNFCLSEDFLRSLHFMMLQHDILKHPGNYRPGPIYVRDEKKGENVYEAPAAELVPKLLREFIQYLAASTDNDHLIVKASMAHLNLVMIHPFSDGNGRMARCLHTLVLATRGVVDPRFSSIEEYLGRNTLDYYKVLADVGKGKWNPANDTRPWIRFNLTAHYKQAATSLRRTKVIAKLWDALEIEIQKVRLPERVMVALSDAAMGFQVRSSHYKHAADVSNVVASRDLSALVRTGFLVASGERRGRSYMGSESIRNLYLGIRTEEMKEIYDPFETDLDLVTP